MMAVLLQYELPSGFLHGLVPTALTMDVTNDGPPVFLTSPLWSELNASGTTQDTPRRLQFMEMSDKTDDGVSSTFDVHCVPVHFDPPRHRCARSHLAPSRCRRHSDSSRCR